MFAEGCGDMFWCGGAKRRCYPAEKRCDGAKDCDNGGDEAGCSKFTAKLLYSLERARRLCSV